MILGAELTLLGTQVRSSAWNTVEARWQWGRAREEGSRRGIRSMMWVGGPEERIATTTELPPGSSSISTLPFPVPSPWSWEISPVTTPPVSPTSGMATGVGVGWGGGQPQLSEGWRGWGSRARCPDGRVCGRGCPQMPSTRQSPL